MPLSTRHARVPYPALQRPLRLALVTEYYYPHLGGICEHVHFFAREARRRGHHVDIITSRLDDHVSEPGVIRLGRSMPVYANGSHARFTLGFGLRAALRQHFVRGAYDLVHVHSPLTPVLPLLAIEEARCPVIGTFHSYCHRSISYRIAGTYFQDHLDKLAVPIAVSPSTTHALERYFRADWQVVPNGIDVEMFRPHLPPPDGVRTDVPVILFLGRFDPRNGLPLLMEAFRKVRSPRRPAQLVIVGDGVLRNRYERLAAGDPDMHFAGAILNGRPAYYANASVYACPTDRASFGITLLEAMASGTPVVCSDIEGFRDVVEPNRHALLVKPNDAGALADALVNVLDGDVLRERLSVAGRQRAMEFSWPSVTDRVFEVYRAVLQDAPGVVKERSLVPA